MTSATATNNSPPQRPEKQIVWNPGHGGRFLVGGGLQLNLYEWNPKDPGIKSLLCLSESHEINCFTWCPHPAFDDLVAMGLSNGRVELRRLNAYTTTTTVESNVIGPSSITAITSRNFRKSNALAFPETDPNMLVVGLDKHKGEPSLVVWDLEQALPLLHLSPGNATVDLDLTQAQSPTWKLSGGQKFESRRTKSYISADFTSCVSFLPRSRHLFVAGIGNKWTKIFDVRVDGQNAMQTSPAKADILALDPFNIHRFATVSDHLINIFDFRKISSPLLSFSDLDASADGGRFFSKEFSTIQFSSTRSGVLASMGRGADCIRFWDITQTRNESTSVADVRKSGGEFSQTRFSRLARVAPSTILTPSGDSDLLISSPDTSSSYYQSLTDTRATKSFDRQFVSFALIPTTRSGAEATDIAMVTKEGDIEIYGFHDTPKASLWSPRGDLVIGTRLSLKMLPGFTETGPPRDPWDNPSFGDPSDDVATETSRDRDAESYHRRTASSKPGTRSSFGRDEKDGFPPLIPTRSESVHARSTSTKEAYTTNKRLIFDHPKKFNEPGKESNMPSNTNNKGVISSQHGESSNVRSLGSSKLRSDQLVERAVEEDISMQIRQRAINGYGPSNLLHNSNMVSADGSGDLSLSDYWAWLYHSKAILPHNTLVHGFDFSYQGILGIWEGLTSKPLPNEAIATEDSGFQSAPDLPNHASSDGMLVADVIATLNRTYLKKNRSRSPLDSYFGNYSVALARLNSRRGQTKVAWQAPSVRTSKESQRRLALALCNWSASDDDIQRWEKDGKSSQAACWLLLNGQSSKAIDVLLRSKDETHQMMSGALAALVLQHETGSPRNNTLIDHCERLIVRLQDPHFRLMLSYVVAGDWRDLLEEETLPLRERLSIALRFLDDRSLNSFLHRVMEYCQRHGRIEGLMITGLTKRGMGILQSYVDATGDVQTAAYLSSLISPVRFQDYRCERWCEAYRNLLDGWRLFHHRCQFDIDRGRIIQESIRGTELAPFEWVPRQLALRCNFCNKVVNATMPLEAKSRRKRAAACPSCDRPLPRCSVCLLSISIMPDSTREKEIVHSSFRDTIDEALVFCQSCKHGGHESHIAEWFFGNREVGEPRRTCAVIDCNCYCDEGLMGS